MASPVDDALLRVVDTFDVVLLQLPVLRDPLFVQRTEHRLVARFVGDDSHLPVFACPANCFHPFQEAFLRELLLPFSDGAPQVVAGCVRHFPDGGSHVLANLRQHAGTLCGLAAKG